MTDSEKELVRKLRQPHVRLAAENNLQAAERRQDERDAAADAIERLLKERDEARAERDNFKGEYLDWQGIAERENKRAEAAEAEVVKLREALTEIADKAGAMPKDSGFKFYYDIARAALKEAKHD